ncbi:hypothetical protein LCGC14_1118510 [marine sediment metagenome]|uniref:SF3 helicase domain-containing protein n=1 Tax=marine sediment metagenome TaxID=412755 RepID=A0A0F9QAI7_9ZZZZ
MTKTDKLKLEYRIVDDIKDKFPNLISIIGLLMDRVENSYVSVEAEVKKAILEALRKKNMSTGILERILKNLVIITNVKEEEFFTHEGWIVPFQNGYYDIINKKFIQYHEKNFFYEIPHKYNENFKGDCTIFKAMLKKYLAEQHDVNLCNVDDIFEIMGYCMIMNVNLKKAVYIFGPPHTGKTTFQTILLHLLGDKNTANILLSRMSRDQFGTDGLQLKILNTVGETENNILKDLSYIKSIAGGDKFIAVEIKGVSKSKGGQARFVNFVKLFFLGNKLPQLLDKDDQAFYDRWIIINFAHPFEVRREKHSDFIINDPFEVQGIIHECIKGLKILFERGNFRPELIQNNRHIWNYNTDNFYRFIHDKCVIDWEGSIINKSLYRSYIRYVVNNKLGKLLSEKALTAELKKYKIFLESHYEKDKRIFTYEGIRLKDKKEIKKEQKEVKKMEKVIEKELKVEYDYEADFDRYEEEARAAYYDEPQEPKYTGPEPSKPDYPDEPQDYDPNFDEPQDFKYTEADRPHNPDEDNEPREE